MLNDPTIEELNRVTEREVFNAPPVAPDPPDKKFETPFLYGTHAPNDVLAVLTSMDEWLGNDEGLMIEDVIAWREQLAKALGKPERA